MFIKKGVEAMYKRLTECRSNEVAAMDKKNTIVVLPVAAHEQHGKHLPVGTDTIILEGVLASFGRRVPADMDVLVLPVVAVGKSNEHMGFCGTLTYSMNTLAAIVRDIAKSVAHHGFEKLVLLNSHGGNTDVLNACARDLRDDFGVRPFVIDWWFTDFWADILKDIQESPRDGVFHACELETSLVMALRPDLVDEKELVATFPPEQMRRNKYVTVFGPVNMGWVTKDITATGVIGDATKGTPEKGEKLLAFAGEKLVEVFREIQAIPAL